MENAGASLKYKLLAYRMALESQKAMAGAQIAIAHALASQCAALIQESASRSDSADNLIAEIDAVIGTLVESDDVAW